MKVTEADVIWTPADSTVGTPGSVRVERRRSGWKHTPDDRWIHADSLGEMGEVSTKDEPTKKLLALHILFNTLVVRDGIPVMDAHKAFLEIDEYRQSISPDAPGAEND
jgi:hypothetical protein